MGFGNPDELLARCCRYFYGENVYEHIIYEGISIVKLTIRGPETQYSGDTIRKLRQTVGVFLTSQTEIVVSTHPERWETGCHSLN